MVTAVSAGDQDGPNVCVQPHAQPASWRGKIPARPAHPRHGSGLKLRTRRRQKLLTDCSRTQTMPSSFAFQHVSTLPSMKVAPVARLAVECLQHGYRVAVALLPILQKRHHDKNHDKFRNTGKKNGGWCITISQRIYACSQTSSRKHCPCTTTMKPSVTQASVNSILPTPDA